MSEPFIGEIRIFGGNYAPKDWAFCDGQIMKITDNTTLYAVIGTTYGGDGRVTFALPDLRAKAPMHPGRGYGLTTRILGQRGGTNNISLTKDQIPAHSHTMKAESASGTTVQPQNNSLAKPGGRGTTNVYHTTLNPGNSVFLAEKALQTTGANQPHDNMQPCLVLNFIISLEGLFPSRN